MSMISYAQNGEDVVLRRVFPSGHRGLYIDVGANNPLEDTVTRYFYEQGWEGINIEPGQIFSQIAQHRPRDVNLNCGLSNVVGAKTFYDFIDFPGSSTYQEAEARSCLRDRALRCVEHSVPVTTLKAVCEEHVRRTIDFISVDVEGLEREVIEGGDWDRYRPRVVVVEATRPNTTIATHWEWEDILWKADYRFALFDGLNRFYLRGEDAHLMPALSAPASCLDNFIPYRLLKQVENLNVRAALVEEVGPLSLAVIRQLKRLKRMTKPLHQLSWPVRRMIRRAA
jgi:FkbM family methyltransferase